MTTTVAAIWTSPLPEDTEHRLRHIFSTHRDVPVFFRADDIGSAHDPGFLPMMQLFRTHHIPLCLAVVPAWINTTVWQSYQEFQPQSSLWCWHQHGYSHTNHEIQGKKAEFGSARPKETVYNDIARGSRTLRTLLGQAFLPVFTPPWNRCSSETLASLAELGFSAVSRSRGAVPSPPPDLPDIPINIDLHTRKEQYGQASWDNLFNEMTGAAASGRMGFMLHHQLMNQQGYAFLDTLLGLLREYRLPCMTFREITQSPSSRQPIRHQDQVSES